MIQLPRFDVSRRGQTGQFTEEVERRFADAIKHLEVPACRPCMGDGRLGHRWREVSRMFPIKHMENI